MAVIPEVKQQQAISTEIFDMFDPKDIVLLGGAELDAMELEVEDVVSGVELERAVALFACLPGLLQALAQADRGGVKRQDPIKGVQVVMKPVVRLMERKPKQVFKEHLKEQGHARIKTFVKCGSGESRGMKTQVRAVEVCEGGGRCGERREDERVDEEDEVKLGLALEHAQGASVGEDEVWREKGGDKSGQLSIVHGGRVVV